VPLPFSGSDPTAAAVGGESFTSGFTRHRVRAPADLMTGDKSGAPKEQPILTPISAQEIRIWLKQTSEAFMVVAIRSPPGAQLPNVHVGAEVVPPNPRHNHSEIG
jgi:hypothetical protein